MRTARPPLPGAPDWDGMIVLCAANDFGGVPMGDWHLAAHLSKLAPVLFVDPPASPLTPLRRAGGTAQVAGGRLRLHAPGLARLTPVVQPFPSRRGMTGLTTALTRACLRRATSWLGGQVLALVSGWPQYQVFGSCAERVAVYWAKDDFAGGARLLGLPAGLVAAAEPKVAARADLVVAASPVVAQAWRDRGLRALLIPFGTDVDAYRTVDRSPMPPGARLPAPVAGFVGRINERTDLALLEAVAARGRSLLLVGPKDPAFEPGRFSALTRLPNVRWVGQQPFEALPGYLRSIDVGLVPYADTAFNRGSFPLKTLEYLAAGRGVVATGLPAIRWLATGLIAIASAPGEFADQVDRLLTEPRSEVLLARRQAFAARHSWARRAADIHGAIAAAAGTASPGVK